MKHSLTLLLILTVTLSNAQYIEYHNLMNRANECRYKKDFEKSLQLFQDGFKKVGYVHSINYAKAAMSAAKLKKYDLVQLYMSKAIAAGYPTTFVNSKFFKGFRKSKEYLHFKEKLENIETNFESKFNTVYKRKIDSLHYIDQKIIRGNNQVEEFKIDPQLSYSDASNFECLLDLIEKFGFPSEQTIGYQGYRKSWIIIHHSARLIENHNYHSTLLDYVKSGAYLPENYCWVIDQGQELLKENLIYYHWDVAKNIDKLTPKEMDEIDLQRKKVGLASIRRIKVVQKSNVKRNKVKW